jgi:hypothetical protein
VRLRCSFAGAILAVAVGLALTSPASAQVSVPTLDGVQIVGDPVVGSTLTAVVSGTIGPSSVEYKWCHQGDRPGKCARGGSIGSRAVYVPAVTDVGYALLVKATATVDNFTIEVISPPTASVVAAPLPPTDPPTNPPTDPSDPPTDPTDPPTDPPTTTQGTAPAPTFASPGTSPTTEVLSGSQANAGAAPLRFLSPFPVVRIRGSVAAQGAWITLLKVTAGRNVRVQVRCQGRGCPIRRRSRTAGRIRALERYLAAGTRVTIRVRRPGFIGKYARIVIRGGRPPSRRDACLLPGNSRPVACPLA